MIKNKWIAALCIVLLFVPSLFAILAFVNAGKAPTLDLKTVKTMEIQDLRGTTYTFEKGKDGGIIDIFVKMNRNAVSIPSLPEQLTGSDFFLARYETAQKSAEYKYYFTLGQGESYYTDASGLAYQIRESDAERFLSTVYASSLYSAAQIPVMTLASGTAVLPSSASWHYQIGKGQFLDCSAAAQTAEDGLSYRMDGGIGLNFSIQPDSLFVTATDEDGKVIFNDTYDKMSGLSLSSATALHFTVDAKWYEDATREYYGELHYDFSADISAPAVFQLGENTIDPGDFVVLTGVNVSAPDKVTFRSEPALICQGEEFQPVFFTDGDLVRALIPTDYATDAKQYTFTVSYGATSQTLTLSIRDKTFKSSDYHVSSTVAQSTFTSATVEDFYQSMKELAMTASDVRYWNGAFGHPTESEIVTMGYGRYATVTSTKQTFRHTGVDYHTPKGTEILAMNDGVVVYTGAFDYSGKLVVIEHGFGLKTWYAHLDSISVSVGDSVKKGDVLGIGGTSGFASDNANHYAVHTEMTVFNIPVCPYTAQDRGIPMYTR